MLEEAIRWRYQAAKVQQGLHAHSGAIEHLNAGLALLAQVPQSTWCKQQTLSFLLALYPSLWIVRGFSAVEIEQVLNQARELLREVGDRRQLFHVLYSLHNFYIARRGLLVAHDMSQELLEIAQELDDPVLLADAHLRDGRVHLHLGAFGWASKQMRLAIESFSPTRSLELADPSLKLYTSNASVFTNQALLLWLLGYPQQAQAHATFALRCAEYETSPFGVSNIYYVTSLLYRELRDVPILQRLAESMATLSARYELPPTNRLHGLTYQGWILAQQGLMQEAIARLTPHIEHIRSTEHTMFQTDRLCILAAVYLQTGWLAQAEAILDEALLMSAHYHERWYDAELHRIHGDLALAQGNMTQAECDYQQALSVARQQAAKSFELRAAMSLSRLWQQQRHIHEAHALLAEIYSWFTEGFGTHDLIEARALLEELS
jgi:tetratricopeptide (TPR) repeat protein